jgi:hypothetical protein
MAWKRRQLFRWNTAFVSEHRKLLIIGYFSTLDVKRQSTSRLPEEFVGLLHLKHFRRKRGLLFAGQGFIGTNLDNFPPCAAN